MPWEPFTAAHIKSRLAARELDVYEDTARKEYDEDGDNPPSVPADSTSRIELVAAQITDRFRGAIQANPGVSAMGPAGTIPSFCIGDAAVLGRVALIGLNPVPEGMTDPRRDEYRAAEKLLESLRSMNPQAFEDALPLTEESTASYGGAPMLDF